MSYKFALISSSINILSAILKISSLSFFTSPMILIAKPGPGNGCLPKILEGTPKFLPIFLTSSLNKSLNGSNRFKFILSGNPPTLWCDLITLALPVSDAEDSITSG